MDYFFPINDINIIVREQRQLYLIANKVTEVELQPNVIKQRTDSPSEDGKSLSTTHWKNGSRFFLNNKMVIYSSYDSSFTITQQVHFLLETSAVAATSLFSTGPSKLLPPFPVP